MTTVTNVNPENQSSSGLPLRGLAMVLIAVAVLLAMWGLYASTQDSSSGDAGAAATTETVVAGQTTGPASSDAPAPASETEDAAESAPGESTPAQAPAPAPAATSAPARLNVLNNSTVPNLAADVADRLRADGFEVGEVGNMPDHILPETTVFFQPGNADAEQRARELAERVGGVARVYEGFLPDGTDGPNDLTLVLVDQVAL